MCYRRVCGSTPGDWGSNNPVFALSLRRCRTTAYTSSAAPRFTNMLLSPRPFGSRSVVRLGVIDPELRPPLVAIPSVRDTAHTFTASGSPVSLVSFAWVNAMAWENVQERFGSTHLAYLCVLPIGKPAFLRRWAPLTPLCPCGRLSRPLTTTKAP